MGSAWSRGREQPEEDAQSPQAAYKYPFKAGPYFGSHFMLGDERFECPQPEGFLFGENKDLNFLNRKPVNYPYACQSIAEPYSALDCLVVVRRDSVKFVKAQCDPGGDQLATTMPCCYNVEFVFDTDAPCTIVICYFAMESVGADGVRYVSKRPELTSRAYEFDVGANQLFSDQSHKFDPSAYKSSELVYDPDKEVVPLVIHCTTRPRHAYEKVQHHSTLAVVERSCESFGFVLKPFKQKIIMDNVSYLLQEVYGLENKNPSKSADPTSQPPNSVEAEDYGAECIVCMSEWRDTLILPCRHLCICSACGESLRYKANNCPICRSPFRALLQVKAAQLSRTSVPVKLTSSDNCMSIDVASSCKRYESVPLVEALNGPMAFVGLPLYTMTPHSTSATTVPSPSAGSKAASNSKKSTRPASLEVQEVLTPEHIVMRVFDLCDRPTSSTSVRPSAQSSSSLYHTSL